MRKVGMLGLGKMGAPMARHLLAKGFNVCGFGPVDAARQNAQVLGVTVLDSAAAVARTSDLAIVVVGFDHEVETVVFGANGIVEAARPGLVVAIGSTVAPRYAARLSERLREHPERMRAALHHASAQNWAMDNRAELSGMPWAEKDMSIVLHEADLARLSLPLCGTVKETIKGLKIRMGLGLPPGSD